MQRHRTGNYPFGWEENKDLRAYKLKMQMEAFFLEQFSLLGNPLYCHARYKPISLPGIRQPLTALTSGRSGWNATGPVLIERGTSQP